MPQDSPPAAREAAPAPAPAPSLAKQVAKGAVWMVAIRFASRTLGLISTLVIARILVPADFGLVAMATAFSTSVDALSEVGLREALIRHPEEARDLYDTAFTMQVLRGLLTGAVVALAAPFAARWFGERRLEPIFLVLAALAVASGFENIAIVEFWRNFRFGMEFALQILPRLLQVAAAIVASLMLHSYWALIIAIAVSRLARLVATYAVHPHRPRLALRRWRDLVGFSFWIWASSLTNQVWQRADAFIVAPVLGAATYGLFSLAWELGRLPVSEFIAPVGASLFPGFAEARRRGDEGTLAPMAVIAFLTMLAVPLAIAISAAAGPVVLVLLGPRWLAARPLVSIIALSCGFAAVPWVSGAVLQVNGRVQRLFAVSAAGAAIRVLLYIHAAHQADVMALAWWAVASFALAAAAHAVALRVSGELRLREGLGCLVRTLLGSVVTVAALWATGWGWRADMPPDRLAALLDGARIGIFVMIVFALTTAFLWRLAGSPHGPESWLFSMLRPAVARLRRAYPA